MIININGQIVNAEDAKISVLDRGFLYGDSVYEVTYSDKGVLLFFDEHLDRLYNSADLLSMPVHYTRDELIKLTLETLEKYGESKCYIRHILTRGVGEISLDFSKETKNNLIILVKPLSQYPQEWYTHGLSLYHSNIIRNDKKSVNPNAKSGNYLNNVMALSEAKKNDFHDAFMSNKEGYLTEATTFNLWFIKDNTIFTPHHECGLLKGITRDKIITLCQSNNINISTGQYTIDDLLGSECVFTSSSTKALVPIYKVNTTDFSSAKHLLFQKISDLYNHHVIEHIHQSKYSYHSKKINNI